MRSLETLFSELRLNPGDAGALRDVAFLVADTGRPGEGERFLLRSLAAGPESVPAKYGLGRFYREITIRRYESALYPEALAAALKVAEFLPDDFESHFNLALIYEKLSEPESARREYLGTLALNPSCPAALSNLGCLCHDGGFHEEAELLFRLAVSVEPYSADYRNNLGTACFDLGKYAEAGKQWLKGLRIKPEMKEMRCNISHLLLLNGRFAEGFREFENRPGIGNPSQFTGKRWRGENLYGKTILLQVEEGLGDTIMFCRYADVLAQMGAKVVVRTQWMLLRLLETLKGVFSVVPDGRDIPAYDYYAPLLSLPFILKTESEEDIPAYVPYLRAEPELLAEVRQGIGHIDGLKIGICWRGRPEHNKDAARSPGIRAFAPLFSIPEAVFFCLQKDGEGEFGFVADNARTCAFNWPLDDFAKTAALMEALDVVVSCDTSVAHLAGALGVSVRLVLPFVPDWRWMLGRSDSPWYPTMKIHRRNKPGDWREMFMNLKNEMCCLAKKPNWRDFL